MLSKKFKYFIFLVLILTIILPYYSMASSDDSLFVWSDISSPTIETIASLTNDKR